MRGEPQTERFAALAARVAANQNAEGGWEHGGGGTLARFYPTGLVAATNLAPFALGCARRAGAEVEEAVVECGVARLGRVQGRDGAFPYGGPGYRKGYESRRTASATLALSALGLAEGERFARADESFPE